MHYKRLSLSFNSFGGNSGGPVVDDAGDVVGVLSSGGGEGGISAGAVHWSEVDALLATIRKRRVFSINNPTKGKVKYQIRWRTNDQWKSYELAANWHRVHWWSGDGTVHPEIRFDCSYQAGYQEKQYPLRYYASNLGRNVKPSLARDAMEYFFRSSGNELDLFKRE